MNFSSICFLAKCTQPNLLVGWTGLWVRIQFSPVRSRLYIVRWGHLRRGVLQRCAYFPTCIAAQGCDPCRLSPSLGRGKIYCCLDDSLQHSLQQQAVESHASNKCCGETGGLIYIALEQCDACRLLAPGASRSGQGHHSGHPDAQIRLACPVPCIAE